MVMGCLIAVVGMLVADIIVIGMVEMVIGVGMVMVVVVMVMVVMEVTVGGDDGDGAWCGDGSVQSGMMVVVVAIVLMGVVWRWYL